MLGSAARPCGGRRAETRRGFARVAAAEWGADRRADAACGKRFAEGRRAVANGHAGSAPVSVVRLSAGSKIQGMEEARLEFLACRPQLHADILKRTSRQVRKRRRPSAQSPCYACWLRDAGLCFFVRKE